MVVNVEKIKKTLGTIGRILFAIIFIGICFFTMLFIAMFIFIKLIIPFIDWTIMILL